MFLGDGCHGGSSEGLHRTEERRAVSPVIGSKPMVAKTLNLTSDVETFVLDHGAADWQSTPQASVGMVDHSNACDGTLEAFTLDSGTTYRENRATRNFNGAAATSSDTASTGDVLTSIGDSDDGRRLAGGTTYTIPIVDANSDRKMAETQVKPA